ncbi:DUF3107 domain-containing protein [Corynebacterium yudongzhengii]|uniref:DUF3107 domain-containing protein n=1 Tax=Corynebacterium yudongzhengii TaxID=2080740 RepID=A0A2U1T507_9CORY|nr:DUF3107 domain-containing protein [Corynebacterium yudongzhengii]AWB81422.1 DUF3107 domain-containing protein [Corynebacterium yudongzhengii]PWC01080.1 DUF3107 domain-containing protein [Corynebacterium yudongzhengii]
MDIKIGFIDSPRELVINAQDNRDELVQRLTEGLRAKEEVVELTDSKGHTFLVNAPQVAYVEIGSANRPAVGFGGA